MIFTDGATGKASRKENMIFRKIRGGRLRLCGKRKERKISRGGYLPLTRKKIGAWPIRRKRYIHRTEGENSGDEKECFGKEHLRAKRSSDQKGKTRQRGGQRRRKISLLLRREKHYLEPTAWAKTDEGTQEQGITFS